MLCISYIIVPVVFPEFVIYQAGPPPICRRSTQGIGITCIQTIEQFPPNPFFTIRGQSYIKISGSKYVGTCDLSSSGNKRLGLNDPHGFFIFRQVMVSKTKKVKKNVSGSKNI